jgi:RIO kinase 1
MTKTTKNDAFEPSIPAYKTEREWIINSLTPFYAGGWITDCLARVKPGKEATVYICEAHPSTGYERVAAKLYRPRHSRSMRNYASYQEGRFHLGPTGGVVKDSRDLRALRKKTARGRKIESHSWLAHEFGTLHKLYGAGVAVPEALAMEGNALLMEFAGRERRAAPTLHEVDLDPDEAGPMHAAILDDVRLMLICDIVHGDLSAYNILYDRGEYRIIDLPQAINPNRNPRAREFLIRDIQRVGDYFKKYGIETDAVDLGIEWMELYEYNALV